MTGEYSFACAYCGETVTRKIHGERCRYCSKRCSRRAQPQIPLHERFWSKVEIRGLFDCWLWQAATRHGYGGIKYGGRDMAASRAAYLLSHGLESLPAHVFVCHHCDERRCVNPAHLFLGTHDENMADAVSKGRMHPGERHGMAKLTDAQIPIIRRQLADGRTLRAIGQEFGVSQSSISRIKRNELWRHIQVNA